MHIGPEWVPTLDGLANPVNRLFIVALVGVGAKHAIPDAENATVVFVDAIVVLAVVHAVIRWRHEYLLHPAKLANELRMHPILIQKINQAHHDKHLHWIAQQGQRNVEHPAEQKACGRLPQRRGQIELLAAVVHHVRGPHDVDFVARAMHPVVAKVVQDQGADPRERIFRIPLKGTKILRDQQKHHHADHATDGFGEFADQANVDRGEAVFEPVDRQAARARNPELQCDQQEENGNGEENGLHGHLCYQCFLDGVGRIFASPPNLSITEDPSASSAVSCARQAWCIHPTQCQALSRRKHHCRISRRPYFAPSNSQRTRVKS